MSVTTVSPSASQPQPTSKPTSSDKVLFRGKDGSVVASGRVLPGETIHGHQLNNSCLIIAVDEVVQVGVQPWFEDPFNEELCKGVIVQWPEMNITRVENFSPIHTRKRKGRH